MAMKNTCTTLQVVLLSVLLFHAPQTLQERIERNAEEIPDADVLEDGRKSVGVRKMLSTKDVIAKKAQFSKDEDTKFESFSNTKTVAPSYVEGTTTSVEAKTLVLKGSGSSTIVSSFSSLSGDGASSTDEASSQNPSGTTSTSENRRLSSSLSSGSSKSSTWRTGGGTTTSWSSSSYSSIRSASSSERSLTSTTAHSDSRTRKGLPGSIPSLSTGLDDPSISHGGEPTEDPPSEKESVESHSTQEGSVGVPSSEAESHQTPSPLTPSTSVSPSTSPSEVEEVAESSEQSPGVLPEMGPWSDDDESENNFVGGIAVLAVLVLLIVLVGLCLIRCCVRRTQNRVGYVALPRHPATLFHMD